MSTNKRKKVTDMPRKEITRSEGQNIKKYNNSARRLAWLNRVKREYAAKHGGYWRTGTSYYNKQSKKWEWEGQQAQRILTHAEAVTIVRRANALVQQALTEIQNNDDDICPTSVSDETWPNRHPGATYKEYRRAKAKHAQEVVDRTESTDGIYAMALRIEQRSEEFYKNFQNYMWNPYEEYDPGRNTLTAWGIVIEILYTAITGEDIGKVLNKGFDNDEFQVTDYTEELHGTDFE